jgi:hypothetical protein
MHGCPNVIKTQIKKLAPVAAKNSCFLAQLSNVVSSFIENFVGFVPAISILQ